MPFDSQTLSVLGLTALVPGFSKGFSVFGAALVFMPLASGLASPLVFTTNHGRLHLA